MIDKSKTAARPADVRSIFDPPDMGKLRQAEEVAKELIGDHDAIIPRWLGVQTSATKDDVERARAELSDLIRQSRAEGAAAAAKRAVDEISELADAFQMSAEEQGEMAGENMANEVVSERHFAKAEAYATVSTLLRARIKSISDPPDMG